MKDGTIIEHRGYRAVITYDDENNVYSGRVLNISAVVAIEGKDEAALRSDLKAAVEDYLDDHG
jgi:predicted HicB family RNase H-like nuclease